MTFRIDGKIHENPLNHYNPLYNPNIWKVLESHKIPNIWKVIKIFQSTNQKIGWIRAVSSQGHSIREFKGQDRCVSHRCVSLQMRSESHPQASTLKIQADSTKPRLISNNSQIMILIGGFNPSEKYDFVSWDDCILNWRDKEKSCSKPPTK